MNAKIFLSLALFDVFCSLACFAENSGDNNELPPYSDAESFKEDDTEEESHDPSHKDDTSASDA